MTNFLHVRATLLIAGLGWFAALFIEKVILRHGVDPAGTILGCLLVAACLYGIASAYFGVRDDGEAISARDHLLTAEIIFGLMSVMLLYGIYQNASENQRHSAEGQRVVAKPKEAQNHAHAVADITSSDPSSDSKKLQPQN